MNTTQQPPQPTPTLSDALTPPADWKPQQFRNKNVNAAASLYPQPPDFEPVAYADETVCTSRRRMVELEAAARAYAGLVPLVEAVEGPPTPWEVRPSQRGRRMLYELYAADGVRIATVDDERDARLIAALAAQRS